MFGLPESVLIFAVLAVTIGLLLMTVAQFLHKELRVVGRTFWCPFRWADVTVEFQEDSFGRGRYLDVKSCTAFRAPSAIGCGKLCRYLRNLPAAESVPMGRA